MDQAKTKLYILTLIIMTTRQNIQRFLEPVKKEWKIVVQTAFHDGITAVLLTGFVYLSQYAVAAIEIGDKELFYRWCIALVVLATVLLFVKIVWKPYIFTFFRNLRNTIDALCMPVIIQ